MSGLTGLSGSFESGRPGEARSAKGATARLERFRAAAAEFIEIENGERNALATSRAVQSKSGGEPGVGGRIDISG